MEIKAKLINGNNGTNYIEMSDCTEIIKEVNTIRIDVYGLYDSYISLCRKECLRIVRHLIQVWGFTDKELKGGE